LPIPPALDTAAQNRGLHSHIMAPQMMGYFMPNISVMAVLNINNLLEFVLIGTLFLMKSLAPVNIFSGFPWEGTGSSLTADK
jgi:hypothetical protein